MTAVDPIADAVLFDVEVGPPVTLADRFTMPPFSVLDRRQGEWQNRRRRWLRLGIQSELGRADKLTFNRPHEGNGLYERLAMMDQSSIFDPVICELVYRWFSRPAAVVLDPFAGGSVRGVVAAVLDRRYTGVDLRPEQVTANAAQLDTIAFGPGDAPPHRCPIPNWLVGDATKLDSVLPWDAEYDLVFSCPPYADLEVYSDDPRDISSWSYDDFTTGHNKAIADAVSYLRDDRYACWVVSDVRDKKTGCYRGLPMATVQAFVDAGCRLLNECVIVDPAGTAPVRTRAPFEANRKVARVHQVLYVFVKGDVRRAADWVGDTT